MEKAVVDTEEWWWKLVIWAFPTPRRLIAMINLILE
jgi:hypothetical protein